MLPLIGWGIRGWGVVPERRRRPKSERTLRHLKEQGTGLPELIAMIGWVLAAQVLPFFYLFTRWFAAADYGYFGLLGVLGVIAFLGALYTLYASHRDLGHCWSALAEQQSDQRPVTSGIYARIRHPMYLSHLLWCLAQLLLLQNWLVGPLALVYFVPLYALRVGHEEELMLAKFGDAYRQYITRSGRLLPPFAGH